MWTNADIESGDDPRLGPALPAIQIAATDLNVRRRAERQAKLILSVQGRRNERREWQSLLAGAGRDEDIITIEWVAADPNSWKLLGRVKAQLPEKPETADTRRSVAGLSASSLLLALLRPLHLDSDADTPLGQQHIGSPWLIVAAHPVEFGVCVPATGPRRLNNHALYLTMVFAFRRARAGAAKPVNEVLRAELGTPEYYLGLAARCAEMPFARILGGKRLPILRRNFERMNALARMSVDTSQCHLSPRRDQRAYAIGGVHVRRAAQAILFEQFENIGSRRTVAGADSSGEVHAAQFGDLSPAECLANRGERVAQPERIVNFPC